jgi:antitoxin Phd
MKTYTFSQARQQFSMVLNYADKEGEVQVTRRDGRVFVIQPARTTHSPLKIKGVNLGLSEQELLDYIHEGRRV